MIKQAVLLLAHGSRDAGAQAEYRRLVAAMAPRLPGVELLFGVLEFPSDGFLSIEAAIERAVASGVERVVALPYFLFAAGHVREDVAGELAAAAARYPRLKVAYQPPFGVEPRLIDVLEARAAEAAARLPAEPSGPTALLVVGAGTSDPTANAELFRAARLLWERRRYELVEVGFVSLTEPSVTDAVRRCRALGAARIVAVPYFLHTGVLSRRIGGRLQRSRQEFPELPIELAQEMNLHPALLDLLTERAQRALAAVDQNGLELPPCAVRTEAWACWLERQAAPAGARAAGCC